MSIVVVSLLGAMLSCGPVVPAHVVGPPAAPRPPFVTAKPGAPVPSTSSAEPVVAVAPPAPPDPATPSVVVMHPHGPSWHRAPTPPRPPTPPNPMMWRFMTEGPRLGTQVSSMTPALRRFFGAPADAGLLVQQIESDSLAERAGVEVGDVLVAVDGTAIAQARDVRQALASAAHDPDEPVEIEVVRRKKRKTLQAALPSRVARAPATREDLEHQLETAQRTLQQVQQQLEALERSESGEAPRKGKRSRKERRARRKQKRATQ